MANPLYGQNKADDKLDAARAANFGGYLNVTADTTLTAKDAGVVTWASNGINITLPAHEKGLMFHLIQTGDYATAVCDVSSADGNDWLGVINAVTGAGDVAAGTDDKVTWGSGTLAGDSISIVSTGSKWVVFNSFSSVTTNGISFG
jgi:hypothetical protein